MNRGLTVCLGTACLYMRFCARQRRISLVTMRAKHISREIFREKRERIPYPLNFPVSQYIIQQMHFVMQVT